MIATALLTLLALMLVAIPVAAAMGVLGMVLGQMYAFLPVSRVAGEICGVPCSSCSGSTVLELRADRWRTPILRVVG